MYTGIYLSGTDELNTWRYEIVQVWYDEFDRSWEIWVTYNGQLAKYPSSILQIAFVYLCMYVIVGNKKRCLST